MPKYPTDKRRYYREDDMSDPTGGRGVSRGRSRSTTMDPHRRQEQGPSSSSHSGAGAYPRRPGQPPTTQPSASHSYPRPSTSTAPPPPSTSYPSSARGEHVRSEQRPQAEFSETASETASVAGSTGGGDSASLGRGGMRGRRPLPPDIITRPRDLVSKQGGYGQPVQLQANYFKLLSTTDWCLNQYRVDFAPEEDRNVVRKGLLRSHRQTLGAYIFDGTVLYTSNRLAQPLELSSERQVDQQVILIKIRHVGEMTRGDHHYIQFFNIIMRKCLDYLQLQLVGRNYFDANRRAEVRDFKLELWPGYITSIRQHERDILLCAEITHKVMRNETLLDVLSDCYRQNNLEYKAIFSSQVIGVIVLTGYNNNTYRIDDVDFQVSPRSTFRKKNGEEISYCDYYHTRYNIVISDMQQPLLVSRSKPRDRRAGQDEIVYLIPELCRSTGLTDKMRSDFKLMSALAKFTRVSPADRIKKLMDFNSRLSGVPEIREELTSWSLQLDNQLVNVPARIFPSDKIITGSGDSTVPFNANWTNEIKSKHLKNAGRLDDWVVIVPSRCTRELNGFMSALMRVAGGMGFQINHPHVEELRDDGPSSYANMLENVKSNRNPMLIFCIATNNRLDRYSAIKKKCCVDRPVPTQVVLAKNLQPGKSQMSIATKVAIQMNCKVGGIPWTVTIPLTGLMVVGFDVCHDTNSKNKDFGAMVASLDVNFGRYFSAVSSHTSGEELSSDLSLNLIKAIQQFKLYNNALPKKIVIYRDGVGEGQVPFVYSHEVQQVKAKLETVYSTPNEVKMAYILVTKKINTRFFYNNQNPSPGTVVDDVVTDPTKYDFFIVSQHVTQGTVTPTAYNVIYDTSDMNPERIQRLTYKLCHMYFNWSGTVRVPAPCQYAHKLAFLVAQAVHQPPNTMLETLLYFL